MITKAELDEARDMLHQYVEYPGIMKIRNILDRILAGESYQPGGESPMQKFSRESMENYGKQKPKLPPAPANRLKSESKDGI